MSAQITHTRQTYRRLKDAAKRIGLSASRVEDKMENARKMGDKALAVYCNDIGITYCIEEVDRRFEVTVNVTQETPAFRLFIEHEYPAGTESRKAINGSVMRFAEALDKDLRRKYRVPAFVEYSFLHGNKGGFRIVVIGAESGRVSKQLQSFQAAFAAARLNVRVRIVEGHGAFQ